jgi:methionyl-tRNA formyltransferase
VELERAVRAFRPAPGAVTRLGAEPIKVWRAHIAPGTGEPGTILSQHDGITVACGDGALAVEELQPAGGRRMSAGEFARGRRLGPGARFE